MRVQKTLSAVVFLLVVAPLTAGPPVGSVADGPPIDKLIDEYIAARKAAEDAVKAAAAKKTEVLDARTALDKRMNEAGLSGPGPVVPPTPIPPADPLARKLWDAYRAEPLATKAEALADLVELMKQAQALADDQTITTVVALAGKVSAAAKTLVKDKTTGLNRLPAVAAIINTELSAAFASDGPLTTEARTIAKAVFSRLQTALTEAGK